MWKIYKIIQKLLIYVGVVFLILPVSFFLMFLSVPKAKAAEAKNVPSKTKEIVKEEISQPPILKVVKGFHSDRIYCVGERIQATFIFEGKVDLKVWANIGNLDATFPATTNLTWSGGAWILSTPELTDNLNLGSQAVTIGAKNSDGQTFLNFEVFLKEKEKIPLAIKSVIGENQISLYWNPQKYEHQYLVEWRLKNSWQVKAKVITGHSIVLTNLEPGSVYEIEITSISKVGKLENYQKAIFETLGQPFRKEVAATKAEVSPPKEITPAIGGGVATVAPEVKMAQKLPDQVQPTEEESPKAEEETEAVGWNRLLVALAILVIAAGAAIGGYYGYEWWAKSKEEPPKSKSSSRW